MTGRVNELLKIAWEKCSDEIRDIPKPSPYVIFKKGFYCGLAVVMILIEEKENKKKNVLQIK